MIRTSLATNPYPQALNRAFLAECRRIVPASGLTRLSVQLYLKGENLAEESRARGMPPDSLGQRMRTWVRAVRFSLGFEARPPHSQRRPRSEEARQRNKERQRENYRLRRQQVSR